MTAEPSPEAEIARLRRVVAREQQARQEAEQISERATRELYVGQQELALLAAVARAANDSADVDAALARALGCICEHTGWPVGHVFLVDPEGGLRSAAIWHLDRPEQFETFRQVTEVTTLASGESLGGRVLATAEPIWLSDAASDPSFAQSRVTADIGVRSGFGCPMLVGSEVVGVMEFFTDRVAAPDERLLDLMGQIGTELGRAIERDRALCAERILHRELAARARELERSNAELEQFASIASHDLQEPLRKVRTFTHRVFTTEADQLSDQGRDYLERANKAAARMQRLVEDLLMFSRVGTRGSPFAPVDLAKVTADVLEDLEAATERSHANVVLGELPTIDADQLQMRQLMQNLVANALKFQRAGTTPEISIGATVHDGLAEIRVRDNGIGFDPRYRDRIFRVFERLHGRSEYEGTGIGLALCRKIVERHGGTVSADAIPDVGATFTVTMPLAQLGPAAGGPSAPDRVPIPVSGLG